MRPFEGAGTAGSRLAGTTETLPAADAPAAVGLSTGAVALRLGVAASTLRSWERRYAIGPAVRADGKHRRWLPHDIARLEEMCRLTSRGVPPAEAARVARHPAAGAPEKAGGGKAAGSRGGKAAGSTGRAPGGRDLLPMGRAKREPRRVSRQESGQEPREESREQSRTQARGECRGLARAAVRLDADAVEEILGRTLDEHGCVTAWEELIGPTLHAVGRKWASAGERYVEVEHLLSWHVSLALRGVRRRPARTDVPPALLACAPGELHSLPLEALWAALGESGLPVRMFGPAVPADALGEAVRRVGPAVVVVWAQSRTTAVPEVLSAVQGVEWGLRGARSHPGLLLAGPGWRSLPDAGSRTLTGLRSGVTLIEQLLTR